ncbi:MAG TPA: hypothetical protein V6C50_05640, partial [Crinalium sp.]
SPTIAPIAKPAETKISLTQDAPRLEVFMPSLLGQAQLHIDQQQISLSQKRLGFQTGRPLTAPRKQISRLEYRKAGSAQNNAEPYLAIWAGTQEYELKSYPPLTVPEMDWLAYELSTWLKLPIS